MNLCHIIFCEFAQRPRCYAQVLLTYEKLVMVSEVGDRFYKREIIGRRRC